MIHCGSSVGFVGSCDDGAVVGGAVAGRELVTACCLITEDRLQRYSMSFIFTERLNGW